MALDITNAKDAKDQKRKKRQVVDLPKPYKHELRIEYPSPEIAQIVSTTVSVDEDLRPERVSRLINCTSNTLHVQFAASELRFLRVAISSFLDAVLLSQQTVTEFYFPTTAAASLPTATTSSIHKQ